MEETELILRLLNFFAPDVYENPAFMQYLKERIESYFDYSFFREMEETLKWKVDDSLQKAWNDYDFMTESSHPVPVEPADNTMHFGEYTVPAYWYKDGMPQKEIDDIILRYKRIWEKSGFGEMIYPLIQDWHSLDLWKENYSEPFLARMEEDLESGTSKEAMRLYYLYSRRAAMYEIDRVYPNKIKRIISVSNKVGSGKKITADLQLLLHNGEECSVRVGTDSQGRHCSTTALTAPGFPLFTDLDDVLIQQALFED